MGNITFFVIFAVLDVSLDVNLCINCSFLHLLQIRISKGAPVREHLKKSFAFELNVNTVKMINTSTDDLKALSLVNAVQLRQPIEQLRSKPSTTE